MYSITTALRALSLLCFWRQEATFCVIRYGTLETATNSLNLGFERASRNNTGKNYIRKKEEAKKK